MKLKKLTKQLVALLLSLCLLLSTVALAAGRGASTSSNRGRHESSSQEERTRGDRRANRSSTSRRGRYYNTDAGTDVYLDPAAKDAYYSIEEELYDPAGYGDGDMYYEYNDSGLYDVPDYDPQLDQEPSEPYDDYDSDYYTKATDGSTVEPSESIVDGTMNVSAGDINEGGVTVNVVADGTQSDIRVDVGEVFAEQGDTGVNHVDTTVGNVSGDEYGIGVNSYDYDAQGDIDVTVSVGDVTVSGEEGASGILVYDYGGDVEISSSGNVSVYGGQYEANGIDVTMEGEGVVDIEVQGDVTANGGSGAGISVQDTEADGGTENSQARIVVTGTVTGTDAAIQVSEDMADNTQVTVWSAKENTEGEIAQVIGADGEVNKEASGLLESAIQYIVNVAEKYKKRVSVITDNTVTVGDGEDAVTYQTAAEDANVTLRFTLGRHEELKGIFYNTDKETHVDYVKDGNSFFIQMLRGGAMLLGLDIVRNIPGVRGVPLGDGDDHHSHRSTQNRSRTEFVYTPLPGDIPVQGVNAAEAPTAQETAHTVSTTLDGGYKYVDIQNKEVVMNSDEIAQFDTLSLEDRMLVMMAAMGLNDTTGAFRDTLSDAAKALAATIDERVAAMSEAERAARTEEVNACFPPRQITVNDSTFEGVGIVLIIDTNGNKSYERYDFYDDNGTWKLHQIEEGKYVTVG